MAGHREGIRPGAAPATNGLALVRDLLDTHKLLVGSIERVLAPFDITFARFEILMLLSFSRRNAMGISRMGALLQVDPSSISSAVDRLESHGLVVRDRSDRDRRGVLVRITASGRQVAAESCAALNARVFAETGLSPQASTQIWSILRTFRRNAGDF